MKSKRGQITLFLIIGIVVLVVFGLVTYMAVKSKTSIKGAGIKTEDSVELKNYVSSCLKNVVENNLNKYGLKENVLENAVEVDLKKCVGDFEEFKNQGYSVKQRRIIVDVTISNNAVATYLNYPIELEKEDVLIQEEEFNYIINRDKPTEIRLDNSGRTLSAVTITSSDGRAELTIPRNTKVNQQNIRVRIKDNTYNKEKFGLASSLVYEFEPTGMSFSPNAILKIEYEDNWFPQNFDESKLKIVYYDANEEKFISLASKVDPVHNKIQAEISHFTDYTIAQCECFDLEKARAELDNNVEVVKDITSEITPTNENNNIVYEFELEEGEYVLAALSSQTEFKDYITIESLEINGKEQEGWLGLEDTERFFFRKEFACALDETQEVNDETDGMDLITGAVVGVTEGEECEDVEGCSHPGCVNEGGYGTSKCEDGVCKYACECNDDYPCNEGYVCYEGYCILEDEVPEEDETCEDKTECVNHPGCTEEGGEQETECEKEEGEDEGICVYNCACDEENTCNEGYVCYEGYCVEEDVPDEEDECTTEWDPVCGKDGKTYSNLCVLEANEVELDYEGECEDGEEVVCTNVYEPVCGVDGETYENECVAFRINAIEVDYDGECIEKCTVKLTLSSITDTENIYILEDDFSVPRACAYPSSECNMDYLEQGAYDIVVGPTYVAELTEEVHCNSGHQVNRECDVYVHCTHSFTLPGIEVPEAGDYCLILSGGVATEQPNENGIFTIPGDTSGEVHAWVDDGTYTDREEIVIPNAFSLEAGVYDLEAVGTPDGIQEGCPREGTGSLRVEEVSLGILNGGGTGTSSSGDGGTEETETTYEGDSEGITSEKILPIPDCRLKKPMIKVCGCLGDFYENCEMEENCVCLESGAECGYTITEDGNVIDEEGNVLDGDKSPEYDIGVHYYPWWDKEEHWSKGYFREPKLGTYDSGNKEIAEKHIKDAVDYGIDVFAVEYVPNDYFDTKIRNGLLKADNLDRIEFAIFYDSSIRFGTDLEKSKPYDFNDDDIYNTFVSDILDIANKYFENENYYKIDGKPVLWIYLTRDFEGPFKEAIQEVRDEVGDIYIIADHVWWNGGNYNGNNLYETMDVFDAVSSYNMLYLARSNDENCDTTGEFSGCLEPTYNEWKQRAIDKGIDFHPAVLPSYDDSKHEIYEHTPMTLEAIGKDSFKNFLKMAKRTTTSSNILWITSWNEWHEGTTIEPTKHVDDTTPGEDCEDNGQETCSMYPNGYYFYDYLQAIKEVFGEPEPVAQSSSSSSSSSGQ